MFVYDILRNTECDILFK